jgi:hypothetical protein
MRRQKSRHDPYPANKLERLGQSLHQDEGSVARQITSTSRSASVLPSGTAEKPAAGFKEAAGFRPGVLQLGLTVETIGTPTVSESN